MKLVVFLFLCVGTNFIPNFVLRYVVAFSGYSTFLRAYSFGPNMWYESFAGIICCGFAFDQ